MDIHNIALVRATNIIPFDGVIRPLSNVPYLVKNIGLEFSARMSDLLRETGIIPPIDYSKVFEEDYYDKMVALSTSILKQYLPYVSDYNSMVLFSLNGLCPDDNEHGFANNTFSNKKCVIIEPLLQHINQAISLVPTDTAIKGDIYLSDEAIILLEKETYEGLSEERKSSLATRNLKLFDGPLKEAILETLRKTNRYIPETLSLSASTGGIMPSDTSEEQKALINNIAETYGLAQTKYFNLITSSDTSLPKYNEVCDEYKNIMTVQNYFMTIFLENLLVTLDAPQNMISKIPSHLYSKEFMVEVMNLIKAYGIDNYKKFLDQYNLQLEEQRNDKTLITPGKIVENLCSKKNK